jgi:hypothetical protein
MAPWPFLIIKNGIAAASQYLKNFRILTYWAKKRNCLVRSYVLKWRLVRIRLPEK